jgi:hypothetical protein
MELSEISEKLYQDRICRHHHLDALTRLNRYRGRRRPSASSLSSRSLAAARRDVLA